jgi:hypothetical protein
MVVLGRAELDVLTETLHWLIWYGAQSLDINKFILSENIFKYFPQGNGPELALLISRVRQGCMPRQFYSRNLGCAQLSTPHPTIFDFGFKDAH